jgi:hypothetical protein
MTMTELWSPDVQLILALGRGEPRYDAEDDDEDQSDNKTPAVRPVLATSGRGGNVGGLLPVRHGVGLFGEIGGSSGCESCRWRAAIEVKLSPGERVELDCQECTRGTRDSWLAVFSIIYHVHPHNFRTYTLC